MRISWAIVCRYVETTEGGTTMVGVGMETSRPPRLPVDLTLNVAVAISVTFRELQGPSVHELTWWIDAPEIGEVKRSRPIPLAIEMAMPDDFHQDWAGGSVIPVFVTFTPEKEGRYDLSFSVDGGTPVTIPYMVQIADRDR